MIALDLFCKAGGAAKGLAEAGFDVVGMDIEPQPHYPYAFIQCDIISVKSLRKFDFIWASPPCQRHSVMTKRWRAERVNSHPDLISPVRKLLIASGVPYCIENVVGAPLSNPVMLCGSMFGLQTKYGSQLRRHRLFECSFFVEQPECRHIGGSAIGVYGGGAASGKAVSQRQRRQAGNSAQGLSCYDRSVGTRRRNKQQGRLNSIRHTGQARRYGYSMDERQRIISGGPAGLCKVYRRAIFEKKTLYDAPR